MARSAVPSRSSSRDEDLIQIDPDFYRNSLPGTLEREREIYYDVEVLAFAANYSALVLLVVSQCGNSIVVTLHSSSHIRPRPTSTNIKFESR